MKSAGLRIRTALLVTFSFAATACQGADEGPPESTGEAGEPAATAPAQQQAALPDTTAEAVWAYLQEQDYESWPTWPGTSALYAGTEPHGMLLTTYVNDRAARPLQAGRTDLPAGAIVVKENYMPDSTLAAVTVMYKVPGFNPEHQDWWFLKRNADGTVEVAGRGEMCQQCHQGAEGDDYLYTPLPGANTGG